MDRKPAWIPSALQVGALRSGDGTTSWTARSDALVALTACAEAIEGAPPHAAAQLADQLRLATPGIASCASDLRSTLVRQACEALIALANALGPRLTDAVADAVLPALLRRAATRKKVMRDSAAAAARAMLLRGAQGVPARVAASLAAAVVDRAASAPVRAAAAVCVGTLMRAHGGAAPALALGAALERAIVEGCADGSEDVRAASRDNLVALLAIDRDLAHSLRDRLPRKTQELVAADFAHATDAHALSNAHAMPMPPPRPTAHKPPILPGLPRAPTAAPRLPPLPPRMSAAPLRAPAPFAAPSAPIRAGIRPALRRESREPGARESARDGFGAAAEARTRLANKHPALAPSARSPPASRRSAARHAPRPPGPRRSIARAAARQPAGRAPAPRASLAIRNALRPAMRARSHSLVPGVSPPLPTGAQARPILAPSEALPPQPVKKTLTRNPVPKSKPLGKAPVKPSAKMPAKQPPPPSTKCAAQTSAAPHTKAPVKRPWNLTPPRRTLRPVRHSIAPAPERKLVAADLILQTDKTEEPQVMRRSSLDSLASAHKSGAADDEDDEYNAADAKRSYSDLSLSVSRVNTIEEERECPVAKSVLVANNANSSKGLRRSTLDSSLSSSHQPSPTIPLSVLADSSFHSSLASFTRPLKLVLSTQSNDQFTASSARRVDMPVEKAGIELGETSRRLSENGDSSEVTVSRTISDRSSARSLAVDHSAHTSLQKESVTSGNCKTISSTHSSLCAVVTPTVEGSPEQTSRGVSFPSFLNLPSSKDDEELYSVSPSQSITLVLNEHTQVFMTPHAKAIAQRKGRLSYIIGANITPRPMPALDITESADTCSETADMHDVLLKTSPRESSDVVRSASSAAQSSPSGSESVVSTSKIRSTYLKQVVQATSKLSAARSLITRASSASRSENTVGSARTTYGKTSSVSDTPGIKTSSERNTPTSKTPSERNTPSTKTSAERNAPTAKTSTKLNTPRSKSTTEYNTPTSTTSSERNTSLKFVSRTKSSPLMRPRASIAVYGQENGALGAMARRPSMYIDSGRIGLRDHNVQLAAPAVQKGGNNGCDGCAKVIEAVKLGRAARDLGWEERLKAARALAESSGAGTKASVSAQVVERLLDELARYAEDVHVRVAAAALDAAFELFLSSCGPPEALFCALERRPLLLRAVVARSADKREAVRLAASRALQSFGVQFCGAQRLALLARVHERGGGACGKRLQAECACVRDVLTRTPHIAAAPRTLDALVRLAADGLRQRQVSVRKVAGEVSAALWHAFEDADIEAACERAHVRRALLGGGA